MFDTTSAVYEWRPNELEHNFGDHLMQLIGERIFTPEEWRRVKHDIDTKYVLLGSFIAEYPIQTVLSVSKKVVLVGCGYRGEHVPSEYGDRVRYIGCRGLYSALALKDSGLIVDPIGDTAMILPLLVKRNRNVFSERIFVPHINDENRLNYSPEEVGCDIIIQPTTIDSSDLVNIIRRISGSGFVLAGAMHAAIVAHAYGIPFAFFRAPNGYLDCPPKWADWLSSVSMPVVDPCFVSNVADGFAWWKSVQDNLFKNRFLPFLKAFSKLGSVRPEVRKKAALLDSVGLQKSYDLKSCLASFNERISLRSSIYSINHAEEQFVEEHVGEVELGLYNKINELSTLVQQTLSARETVIRNQSVQLNIFRDELLRAEAQLDLLKDLMLGGREEDRL